MKIVNKEFKYKETFFFIAFSLYKCLLDYGYVKIIIPLFGYYGFEMNFSLMKYFIGWLMAYALIFVYMPFCINKSDKLSYEILFVVFVLVYIPFSVMAGIGSLENDFIIANFIFAVVLASINKFNIIKAKSVGLLFNGKGISEKTIDVILVLSLLVVLYVSGRYTGFRFTFNLLNVYDLRDEASSYNLSTVLTYLYAATKAINTILISYYAMNKKLFKTICCFVVQLLSFGIDGSKSVLFYAILALLIGLMTNVNAIKINKLLLVGLICVVLLSCMIYFLFDNFIVFSLFVRRVLFVPVRLEECYFDFFSINTPDYYKLSFLRYFGFKSQYSHLPKLIGATYFHSPDLGANNGLISDAMANLGFAGIIIVPIIVTVVIKVLDICAFGLDTKLYLTIAIYVGMVFINSFIFTGLLTHGIIAIILLLAIMKRGDGDNIGGESIVKNKE